MNVQRDVHVVHDTHGDLLGIDGGEVVVSAARWDRKQTHTRARARNKIESGREKRESEGITYDNGIEGKKK